MPEPPLGQESLPVGAVSSTWPPLQSVRSAITGEVNSLKASHLAHASQLGLCDTLSQSALIRVRFLGLSPYKTAPCPNRPKPGTLCPPGLPRRGIRHRESFATSHRFAPQLRAECS